MSAHDHHNPSDHHPHVMPMSMYAGVTIGLIILTVVTVYTARIMPEHLEMLTNMKMDPTVAIIIAMVIAMVKATLVCLFFMHLKYDTPINRLTFISGIFFLSLFFIFTLGDTLTRADAPDSDINSYTPEKFRNLTERPAKPIWLPAVKGFQDNGEPVGGLKH